MNINIDINWHGNVIDIANQFFKFYAENVPEKPESTNILVLKKKKSLIGQMFQNG